MKKAQQKQRLFEGTVVSDKMDKTVVVQINRSIKHAKYHKRYTVSKKYHCHDEKKQYHVGDQVIFIECRPYSKLKKWRVLGKK